jgi:DNA invertase Pin-like site-specific DNA recombinase
VVSLDLPMSHQLARHGDEFTGRMLTAINDLMLDMLAAVARKDYQDRRRRQKEGIEKAKLEGKYRGRGENRDLFDKVEMLLKDEKSYSTIIRLLGCSRATIAKVAKIVKSTV